MKVSGLTKSEFYDGYKVVKEIFSELMRQFPLVKLTPTCSSFKPSLAFLDKDGTLTKTGGEYIKKLSRKFSIENNEKYENPKKHFLMGEFRQKRPSKEVIERLIHYITKENLKDIQKHGSTLLHKNIKSILKKSKKLPIDLHLVTSNHSENTKELLTRSGIENLFKSWTAGQPKDEVMSQIILKQYEQDRSRPIQAVKIGDAFTDLIASKQAEDKLKKKGIVADIKFAMIFWDIEENNKFDLFKPWQIIHLNNDLFQKHYDVKGYTEEFLLHKRNIDFIVNGSKGLLALLRRQEAVTFARFYDKGLELIQKIKPTSTQKNTQAIWSTFLSVASPTSNKI